MKNLLVYSLVALLSSSLSAQVPAVEWVEINTGGLYGGSYGGINTANGDFLSTESNSSRTQAFESLNFYSPTGIISKNLIYTQTKEVLELGI